MPILVGRYKAMYFEPANRKAFPILTVWMPEFIISVTSLADTTSNAATTIFAVRTNRRMVVVDNKGRTVLQLPLTPVLKGPQSATLSVNVLPANTGFCFWLQDQGSSALTAIQFDNKGHEMQQQTFRRVVHNTHDNASQARSVFYSPALLACRAAGIKLDEFGTGRGSRGTRVALPSALLSGLISALLLLPIALRLRWSRTATAAWAAGCFAIGPALVLTVLALYGWPALVPCASCGRKRIVTRDLCEHCGAAWPEAAPDATEIFESDGIL